MAANYKISQLNMHIYIYIYVYILARTHVRMHNL